MTTKGQNKKSENPARDKKGRSTNIRETEAFQMKMKIARQCMERYHNALKKLAE